MSETRRSPPAADQESDERFKRLIAILITSMIIIAAFVTLLQTRAGARSARAGREAQSYAIRAMGLKTSGQAQVSYDWQGAYQNWVELNDLATLASRANDEAAAVRYRAVRDRIVELSPLLNSPYFNSETDSYPDVAGYESDVYLVQATALSEHYTNAATQNEAWDDKARAHTAQLTMLAVTLSLYGLSTTISGRVTRWLFVAAGTVIAVFTLFWVLIILFLPVPQLSDAAIEAYAQGVGQAWRGTDEATQEAIANFDQALAEKPDYANALYERGNAYYFFGNYQAAAEDFEAAQAAGRDDTNVAWNLGWTYYLLGNFEDAIRADRHALDLDPELVGVRTNLGLALLVAGQINEAYSEYQIAMDTATRQVAEAKAAGREPPASLWLYLDAGAIDLDNLLDTLNDQPHWWTQAPAPETVADPDTVRTAAEDLLTQIKSLIVALEYTGQPPADEVSAVISPLEFGLERYDEEGNFVDYDVTDSFPYGTDRVLALFDYDSMQDGQRVVWKVYYNGVESPSLRLVSEWTLGESGAAEKPLSYAYSNFFIFGAGEYEVEMYVDSHLMQRGRFTVREPEDDEAPPDTPPAQSGDILFQDDFSNPTSGWGRFSETDYSIDYTEDRYRISVTAANWVTWGTPGLTLEDVSIEVEATKFSGPESNFGVICRFVDNSNFYVMEVTDTGYYGIYKMKDGEWTQLDAAEMQFSEAILQGEATNVLRADCVGDTFALYVNDQLLAEAQDPDFTSGDVGLLAGTYDQPNIEILFDNFVVLQP